MAFHGQAQEVFSVAVVFFVLSWVTIALRMWVRIGILKALGRDDYCMAVTQIFFTIYLTCQIGGVIYGTGRHLKDLVPWRAEKALAYWWGCEVSYIISTTAMKVSIGLFLLRVAVKRVHIWIIRATMASSAVTGIAFAFVVLLQCWPVHAFWTLGRTDGRCIDANVLSALTYVISGLNVVADWIFGVLPAFIVKDLQMPRRRKISVACILAFAAIGSTATIVRLPYVWRLKESSMGYNGDFLYDTVGIAIWTTVEVGIGITAGCFATLWPLVQLFLAKFGVHSTQQNSGLRTPVFAQEHRGNRSGVLELDGLKPGHGITTFITSKQQKPQCSAWPPQHSSEENLASPNNMMRQIIVEYDDPVFELGP